MSSTLKNNNNRFDEFYQQNEMSFGSEPTEEIDIAVKDIKKNGIALDLGCGDGRNSIHLAKKGLKVDAVDSSKTAVKKLMEYSDKFDLQDKIDVFQSDIKRFDFKKEYYDIIVGITILDHLAKTNIRPIFDKITKSLKLGGKIVLKVHSTADPGYSDKEKNQSELSKMINHYFDKNELKDLLESDYDIIHYEESKQLDQTHGEPHYHGFVTAVAVKETTPTKG